MASFGTFSAAGSAFANDTPTPYTIVVSGLTGEVSALSLKINQLTHPDFLFLHFLLVAPDGQSNLMFFDRSGSGINITNQSFLFTDFPDQVLPVGFSALKPSSSGGRPDASDWGLPSLDVHYANIGGVFSPAVTFGSAFGHVQPNGTWTMYVLDDDNFDPGGTFASWDLSVVDNVAPVITTPANPVQVDAGSSIKFSAANGNLPTSNDPDFNSDFPFLKLTTEHGTIENGNFLTSFAPTKSYGVGTGLNDIVGHFMTDTVYKPDAGFSGVDHLTITVIDNGGDNGLGSLTTTKTIDIEVFDHKVGTSGDDSYTASGYQKIDGGAGKDTITFDFALTEATVTYEDNKVTIEGPGTKTVLSGFEKFVFNDGTVDNADGSPLIDDLYYYTRYHDVWAAHIDPEAHYAAFGWHEGRNPNAFFDTNGYLATYADVKTAGINPLTHYDTFGWKEGRDPSTGFDTGNYLSAYADVNAAHVDPLAHFLQFGYQEARHAFGDGVWG